MVYTLPSSMKHYMDHDDKCYYTHKTDLSISDFVQEVVMVDPL